MSKITKSEQIAQLTSELNYARIEIHRLSDSLENSETALDRAEKKLAELYAENDKLIHTPEFKADTEAAFDRGRQDGVRSLTARAQKDMLGLSNDIVATMNELVNKYTRDLAVSNFLGTLEQPEVIKDLPATDFTEGLLDNIKKIDMKTSETEYSVVQ